MAVPQRSNFTNLQQLINANQSNQLGNTIQSGVQQGVAGLQSGVNQAQNQFQDDVNSNKLDTQQNQQYTQNAIGNIINPPSQTAPAQTTSSDQNTTQNITSGMGGNESTPSPQPQVELQPAAATAGPSKLESATPTPASAPAATSTSAPAAANSAPGSFGAAPSQPATGATATPNTYTPAANDVSQFGKLLQGNYAGPSQLNNYNTLLAQGQNLQGLGQNLNTQGGLQSLLQQYVGGNNYTQGQQGLDTLLLGQTGKPQLQNVARSLQNVIKIPQTAESQAQGLAQTTATGNQNFAQNLRNQLSAAQSPILQNIQQQIDAANKTNQGIQTNASTIYDLLNNPTAPMSSTTNRIGGHAAGPVTDYQTAQQALKDAAQYGMVDPVVFNQINKIMATMNATGGNAKDALMQAFNNVPTALPQYSLQQGANAQQASQLNALQQLGGQAPQYTNYGGLAPVSAGYDMTKLPSLNSLTSKLLTNPNWLDYKNTKGAMNGNPDQGPAEAAYNAARAAYWAQQAKLKDILPEESES